MNSLRPVADAPFDAPFSYSHLFLGARAARVTPKAGLWFSPRSPLRMHSPSASPAPLWPRLPGRPRMVKYGRHSVNPELCCTQLLQSPSYWNTEVTGLSYRSWVLHISIPVAAMQPARPRRDRRSPTTWHVVVAMASAAGPRPPGASHHPPAGKACGLAGRGEVS